MKLFTADEIRQIYDAFSDYKVGNDEAEQCDYISTVQSMAHIMKEFLDAHAKPKRMTFLGLFGSEDDKE